MICEKNRRDSLCLSLCMNVIYFFHYEERNGKEQAMNVRLEGKKKKDDEEEEKKLSSFIENWKDM